MSTTSQSVHALDAFLQNVYDICEELADLLHLAREEMATAVTVMEVVD